MRSDLITTTQNVWSRIFARPVEPSAEPVSLAASARGVCSAIRMKGSVYALIVHATDDVVRRWAGSLFDCEPAECTDTDLIDVIGELSNVVSGGFKHRLGHSIDLALPDARFGTPPQLFDSGYAEVSVVFNHDLGPFWMILWRLDPSRTGSDSLDNSRSQ